MNEIKLDSVEYVPIHKEKKEYNPLCYCCNTCKNLPECEKELRKIWTDNFDVLCNEFECDFYRRKNSGAFRRKCRKFKKEREKIDNILKDKIIKECDNDFYNLRVYVNFNPNCNVVVIFVYHDVFLTKNEITYGLNITTSIDVSLEYVKKDMENVVKQIHYEIKKSKHRELERFVNYFDRGTEMVTGETLEEMKGEN